ncbi:MAG: NAD(P)/FAD-dependent oxidoreductase [Actinomycetota bacterium]
MTDARTDEFDVVVVGAGSTGENAAGRAADGGLSVAIVEERLVGGECSYYACIPSKALIRPGDVIADAKRVPGAAEAVTGQIDVSKALAQRDSMTSSWDDSGQIPWLDSKRVELVRGTARLDGERTLVVSKDGGQPRRITARKAIVIASGTRAMLPPIEGLSAARVWDNRDATAVKEIPRRFITIGGGPVGAELAQAFRRLGSAEVTVIEGGPRLMAREEPFAGDEVRAAFEAEGITVLTNTRVTKLARDAHGVTATLSSGDSIVADEVLVAAGRTPNTDAIGLETVGLESLKGKYLPVDRQFRVQGSEWLYAVGDVNGLALLTHMGKYQARLAGDILAGKPVEDRADYVAIPRVTFTDPQVAAVGFTEAQAKEKGIPLRVVRYKLGDVSGTYLRGKGISGTAQIVVDESKRVIVGATFTGPDVQEMVHAATIAIVGRVTVDDLWHAVPAFPTMSEVWLRLLETYGL